MAQRIKLGEVSFTNDANNLLLPLHFEDIHILVMLTSQQMKFEIHVVKVPNGHQSQVANGHLGPP